MSNVDTHEDMEYNSCILHARGKPVITLMSSNSCAVAACRPLKGSYLTCELDPKANAMFLCWGHTEGYRGIEIDYRTRSCSLRINKQRTTGDAYNDVLGITSHAAFITTLVVASEGRRGLRHRKNAYDDKLLIAVHEV